MKCRVYLPVTFESKLWGGGRHARAVSLDLNLHVLIVEQAVDRSSHSI